MSILAISHLTGYDRKTIRKYLLGLPPDRFIKRGRSLRARLCRPYRAQTKGKIESGVTYVRRNLLCGLLGREPSNLADFNSELRRWEAEVPT